jgi:hypothetical protein
MYMMTFMLTDVSNDNLGIENGGEMTLLSIVTRQTYRLPPKRGSYQIREVTNDLALAVSNVANIAQRNQFFGELINFPEKVERISDAAVQRMSLEKKICWVGTKVISPATKLGNGCKRIVCQSREISTA